MALRVGDQVLEPLTERDQINEWRQGPGAWMHLKWQKVQLEFRPTERSRKWHKASSIMNYTEVAYRVGLELMLQEGWHSFRWVPLQW